MCENPVSTSHPPLDLNSSTLIKKLEYSKYSTLEQKEGSFNPLNQVDETIPPLDAQKSTPLIIKELQQFKQAGLPPLDEDIEHSPIQTPLKD